MARVKAEKEVQRVYRDRRAQIIRYLSDPGDLWDIDHLVWEVEKYAANHKVDSRTAASEVRAAARRAEQNFRTGLYPVVEHQHIWVRKANITGEWNCLGCTARGKWSGDDCSPMEVVE